MPPAGFAMPFLRRSSWPKDAKGGHSWWPPASGGTSPSQISSLQQKGHASSWLEWGAHQLMYLVIKGQGKRACEALMLEMKEPMDIFLLLIETICGPCSPFIYLLRKQTCGALGSVMSQKSQGGCGSRKGSELQWLGQVVVAAPPARAEATAWNGNTAGA